MGFSFRECILYRRWGAILLGLFIGHKLEDLIPQNLMILEGLPKGLLVAIDKRLDITGIFHLDDAINFRSAHFVLHSPFWCSQFPGAGIH
jgi:hypothetical protein